MNAVNVLQLEIIKINTIVFKFKVAGVECRPKSDICDLPEYCNGTFYDCPEDVYVMDGYPCNNMKDYCYSGICENYDSQCESLFGKGTV